MATTGAPYNLPYPLAGDAPTGAAQIQALAAALVTELTRVDAAAAALTTSLNNHAAATTAHGSGSAVVGKDQAVTLTNKTMDFRGGATYNTAANILWTAVVQSVGGTTLAAKLTAIDNSITTLQGSAGAAPAWTAITGKPATFPPDAHSHAYAATTHTHSQYSTTSHDHDSVYALFTTGDTFGKTKERCVNFANATGAVHSRSVSGSGTYYAVWVDGSGDFCRNTSSRRYKENIRTHAIDPAKVLALRPVMYDRINGQPNEFGLIAEEVDEQFPEITTRDENGLIDALRYDLLSVALLSVVQDQEARIAALEEALGS